MISIHLKTNRTITNYSSGLHRHDKFQASFRKRIVSFNQSIVFVQNDIHDRMTERVELLKQGLGNEMSHVINRLFLFEMIFTTE